MKAWGTLERQRFRRAIVRWYDRAARALPWRGTRDPYAIWVSEIMLQQTQVATVLRYYHRFLEAFPTISDLAQARRDDVFHRWEGLGYYRRAAQLHAAARQIESRHAGQLPRAWDDLTGLPGIGRYTAGAILSFAFDEPRPILEANTTRLWCRLLGYRDDPTRSAGQRLLWQAAEDILPRRGSGRLNQALMELGSQICQPAAPRCAECPVSADCEAFRRGEQAVIPVRRTRAIIESITEAAVVIHRRGRVLLRQCPPDERWAGLWDYPRLRVDLDQASTRDVHRDIVSGVRRLVGMDVRLENQFLRWRHGVTRYDITLLCFRAEFLGTKTVAPGRRADPLAMGLATGPLSAERDRAEDQRVPGSSVSPLTERSGIELASDRWPFANWDAVPVPSDA